MVTIQKTANTVTIKQTVYMVTIQQSANTLTIQQTADTIQQLTLNWNYITSSLLVIIEYILLRSILSTFENTTGSSEICWLLYPRYEKEGDIQFFLYFCRLLVLNCRWTLCVFSFSKTLIHFNKTIIMIHFYTMTPLGWLPFTYFFSIYMYI